MTFLADSVPLGIFGKGSSSLCGLNSGQHLYIPVQPRETVSTLTHVYGVVVASAYPVDGVSISIPGRVILKKLKIVPNDGISFPFHIVSLT